MAGITLAQAQDQLDAALSNLSSVRKFREQQVAGSVGGRRTINQDLQQAQSEVQFWDQKVKALSRGGGGPTFVQVVPCA